MCDRERGSDADQYLARARGLGPHRTRVDGVGDDEAEHVDSTDHSDQIEKPMCCEKRAWLRARR
jgi:hypothetical protein